MLVVGEAAAEPMATAPDSPHPNVGTVIIPSNVELQGRRSAIDIGGKVKLVHLLFLFLYHSRTVNKKGPPTTAGAAFTRYPLTFVFLFLFVANSDKHGTLLFPCLYVSNWRKLWALGLLLATRFKIGIKWVMRRDSSWSVFKLINFCFTVSLALPSNRPRRVVSNSGGNFLLCFLLCFLSSSMVA